MATLKQVNAHIQSRYPDIKLIKGSYYFWVASDEHELGTKLAMLYTTSILCSSINHLTLGGWMDAVERILRDAEQPNRFDRNPII